MARAEAAAGPVDKKAEGGCHDYVKPSKQSPDHGPRAPEARLLPLYTLTPSAALLSFPTQLFPLSPPATALLKSIMLLTLSLKAEGLKPRKEGPGSISEPYSLGLYEEPGTAFFIRDSSRSLGPFFLSWVSPQAVHHLTVVPMPQAVSRLKVPAPGLKCGGRNSSDPRQTFQVYFCSFPK